MIPNVCDFTSTSVLPDWFPPRFLAKRIGASFRFEAAGNLVERTAIYHDSSVNISQIFFSLFGNRQGCKDKYFRHDRINLDSMSPSFAGRFQASLLVAHYGLDDHFGRILHRYPPVYLVS